MSEPVIIIVVVSAVGVLGLIFSVLGRARARGGSEERAQQIIDRHNVTTSEWVDMSPADLENLLDADDGDDDGLSLTITIPGEIMPMERFDRFASPLEDALGDLGQVVGGGTAMEERDGEDVVVEADIEVNVTDVDAAIAVIRTVMLAQNAPEGTTITQYDPEVISHNLDGSSAPVP